MRRTQLAKGCQASPVSTKRMNKWPKAAISDVSRCRAPDNRQGGRDNKYKHGNQPLESNEAQQQAGFYKYVYILMTQ